MFSQNEKELDGTNQVKKIYVDFIADEDIKKDVLNTVF